MKITCVVGTRPEFIKMFPVVAELRRRGESPTILATGQHDSLLRGTPFEDGMAPDVNLKLPGTNDPIRYAGLLGAVLREKLLAHEKTDIIVVQGDTASAYAGAWAASELEIPVAHVEAGIRTGDLTDPWPEEEFRVWIDHVASQRQGWNFAPTDNAKCNLLSWGHAETTGNTGIDALYSHTPPVEYYSERVEDRVLITLHRRESFGEPLRETIRGLIAGVNQHKDLMFWWVTHPNPRVQEALPVDRPRNLILVPPLGTVEFAHHLATAQAVISDSGGVQEEAAALGIPCVVAREKTDRPESVELGLAQVAGRTEAGILAGLAWALDAKIEPSDCFGDGHAAPRIVEHLLG